MEEDMDPALVAATSSFGAYHFPVYEPPEWGQHRAQITKLYEKHELKVVMSIMKADHGFKASENQYKKQIAKWGLNKKHIKAKEYKAMIRMRREREGEGKKTEFILHGQKVPDQNIARFEDRMMKSDKMTEDETFSEVESPKGLLCRTPTPPGISTSTILQIPSRAVAHQRSIERGLQDQAFFAHDRVTPDQLSDSQMEDIMLTSSPRPAPQVSRAALETSIGEYSRALTSHEDQESLRTLISSSQPLCDEFCSQCESFGYRPGARGCLLHRCLARISIRFMIGQLTPQAAEMLCRGAVHALLSAPKPPLASLLRIAADIIWISLHAQQSSNTSELATAGHFPPELLDPKQSQMLYRPLASHTALTLSQSAHPKEAILTLKSVLGIEGFEDLREVYEYFISSSSSSSFSSLSANLSSSTLSFERAVTELTSGRVRAFRNGGEGGWMFFDCDAEEESEPARTWYREVLANGAGVRLKKEEIIVRAIAVRTMVEIEFQRRRAHEGT